MTSSFGHLFRITTFGESHGHSVGVVVDGCPPGLTVDMDEVQAELDRRRPGQSRLVTQRDEADRVEVLSGLFEGRTTGTPITMVVANADQRPGAYDHLKDLYRPSHADYTYRAKYGHRDHRGGGRSSVRESIGRVAAGALARQLLANRCGIEVLGWVSQVGDVTLDETVTGTIDQSDFAAGITLEAVEADPTRCPDPATAAVMTERIEDARRRGDSLGGTVTVVARRVPPGLGEPVFDRLDADLAKAMLSIPATKAFEMGSGFAAASMTGLAHNDPFVPGDDPDHPAVRSNHAGGVLGGISSGATITCRIGFKPTATISSAQDTVTTSGVATVLAAKGRHDPCVLPRAVPIVEAMMNLVLADHWLRQQATRS